ncbi:MAG TPA: hypothetical protein PKO28_00380 [Bacilli bacterium]|nr:hypothetical protein [Bacilli bacterium]HPS19329.1 hypothetical protein [Bacilli bacterium]
MVQKKSRLVGTIVMGVLLAITFAFAIFLLSISVIDLKNNTPDNNIGDVFGDAFLRISLLCAIGISLHVSIIGFLFTFKFAKSSTKKIKVTNYVMTGTFAICFLVSAIKIILFFAI